MENDYVVAACPVDDIGDKMTQYTNTGNTVRNERSLGDLFGDLSARAGLLVRQEMQLAKVEMKQKATAASRNIALVVAGAVLGNAALLALIAALIVGLANFMDAWLAALLVGVVLAIIAGILAATGIQALRTMDPAPERTIETLREDREWLTRQMS